MLVECVSVILGNDLAGGKVFPCPIVVDKPVVTGQPDVAAHFPAVFPTCAVTRAQSQKWDVVDLTDSFINPVSDISEYTLLIKPEISSSLEKDNPDSAATSLEVGKEYLAAAQKEIWKKLWVVQLCTTGMMVY
ncbi:leucine zipper tumor suppressor 3-like protein [Labeo rohita]|uniref:Leucine zipper tumor suppressor 3-like protein n=1 Tax=Labeo rohita TaxID=84645 RepID=A0A498LVY5_LABRO|nr:leucine zipper tumor suppressor 3-like protein [Labeo rohita]